MAFEHYVRCGQTKLRCGFTTGTCAALAASGATRLLLTGEAPQTLSVVTPKGWTVEVVPAFCTLEAVMFSNAYGFLGQTGAAAELLAAWKGDKA